MTRANFSFSFLSSSACMPPHALQVTLLPPRADWWLDCLLASFMVLSTYVLTHTRTHKCRLVAGLPAGQLHGVKHMRAHSHAHTQMQTGGGTACWPSSW